MQPLHLERDTRPSHTTIYTSSLEADFNHCTASSPAGDICSASFHIWGNGSSIQVDTRNPVTVFFSQTALPEPSAWALMLTGFLGVGAMLRRRRAALAWGQRTIGGIEERMVSMLPPAFRPNMVPRS